MKNSNGQRIHVALDIGTAKVACLIGTVASENEIHVLGLGVAPSHGLKRGMVVNIEETVNSINQAVRAAETMSGCSVHSVTVSLSGARIHSSNSRGMVAVRNREVTDFDLERVIDAAKAVTLPAEQRVLHILAQDYEIDHQGGIREPVGMSGVRLEARIHLVSANTHAMQNIEKCVQRCGLEIDAVVLASLASGQVLLTDDEKELGVCLLDIGAGTADMAIYAGGVLTHSSVIPLAGDQVTNDLAMALRTPSVNAEQIKIKYASAFSAQTRDDEIVNVQGISDGKMTQVSRHTLAEVVQPRYEEIFSLVQQVIKAQGYESLLGGGIVLTGGAAKIEGLAELAEQFFEMPARIAKPTGMAGEASLVSGPAYATVTGLLLQAAERSTGDAPATSDISADLSSYSRYEAEPERAPMGGVFNRFKSWLQGNY